MNCAEIILKMCCDFHFKHIFIHLTQGWVEKSWFQPLHTNLLCTDRRAPTYRHAHRQARTHTHARAHAHTHAHVHTRTHTHTHTHTPRSSLLHPCSNRQGSHPLTIIIHPGDYRLQSRCWIPVFYTLTPLLSSPTLYPPLPSSPLPSSSPLLSSPRISGLLHRTTLPLSSS